MVELKIEANQDNGDVDDNEVRMARIAQGGM